MILNFGSLTESLELLQFGETFFSFDAFEATLAFSKLTTGPSVSFLILPFNGTCLTESLANDTSTLARRVTFRGS
jgi:hypothetical protein